MKFYSLSTGAVNHLLSDHEGREMDLPFEVTNEEREIITFPRSSFILGRSGTGKTTILTMKLYQKLQQYVFASPDSVEADKSVHISNEVYVDEHLGESGGPILHQLFVTVSPKLCYAIKKHVSQLKSFVNNNFSGSNKSAGMDDNDETSDFDDIPDTFVGIQQEKYPLIITFHKFLMMLDGTLGNSYFQRFHDVRDSSYYESRRSVALSTFMRKNEVTYDRFWSLYWPHFNTRLTKGLDASRVFTEIMSHIKGGVHEGEVCDMKRCRQDYISLSESRVSTLNAERREVIYDIFEDYEKMKSERGEFDLADLVIDIHIRLMNEDIAGDKMDFVYIDEVQDLTMKQISLLKYICKNVDEGFVFCGDTAQTIARGIDFRFEDIRSLFYNEFLMKSRNSNFSLRREKGLISDTFCLTQNFRTHTGVLRLAQSVIDLICHYFPQSIDSLAPETSLIYGESPVVLEPGSDENIILTIFGHSGKAGGKWVGFGADQVILVRDDFVRKEISSYIGDQALVLTIVECKGLEFQDVLLYNFFGSSPMSDKWRVIYEFLKEKDLLDADSPKSFPSFNQSRHNILCSELKQLYVAITRTRQRLWICENDEELSKPMLDYWRRSCLVQVRKLDDSLAEAMQRASSPEEWKSQGIKLFHEKNYEMATMCFEKAGEETWEKRAKASGLRAAADSLRGSNSKEANIMLREAAEIFDSIDRVDSAAECFCDLGDYEKAGRIYLEKCGMSELRKAGECFSLAGNYETAAEVYAKGNFFRECLSACIKGNYFDLGLQYIDNWKQQASSNNIVMARLVEIDKIAQEFLENCAMECYRAKDNASLMKYVRAFHSMESKRKFLKSLDCLGELLTLEEESGNFNEAAEIAKCLGDVLREVDLLEKAEQFANASLLTMSYVLSTSLWSSRNRGWPLKSFPGKVEFSNRAISVAKKVSGTFHASIRVETKILLNEQKNLCELIQSYIASKQYNTETGEIISVRQLLDAHLEVHTRKYEWDPELHLDSMFYDARISRNQVSGGTLVYLWNLWRIHSLKIVECLDSLERSDFIKCEGTELFCFNYFGVRLQDNFSLICHLLNPDAAWVKNVDVRFMRRNRKVVALEVRHFASAARKYWLQELLSIGLRVLEALQELYKSCMQKRLPEWCRSMCLLYIFDIAKFINGSNSFNRTKAETWKLHDFLLLTRKYIEFVFPLDARHSLSENMISLRETELSNNLLEEIVSMNISNQLTYGEVGRAVMIMLESRKPKHDLYDRIIERLPEESAWRSFIENLRRATESQCSKTKECAVSEAPKVLSVSSSVGGISHSEFVKEALSLEFHKALEETYNVHWGAYDYISPKCFFYLVERLLILVPHPQGFFFTAKSSFVEYLLSLPSDSNARDSLLTNSKFDTTAIYNFAVSVVRDCITNSQDTADWIRKSRIDCKYYFPVLMLRLFVIMCLSCLNSGFSSSILFQLLSLPQIRVQLPPEFYQPLRHRRQNLNLFVLSVANAFRAIGDPLVLVASSENSLKYSCPDAIFLDLRSFTCRKEIMETMFPRSSETSPSQPSRVERNETSSIEAPPIVSDQEKSGIKQSLEMTSETDLIMSSEPPVESNQGESSITQSSETISETDSKMSSENGEGNLHIKPGVFREMYNDFESFRNRNDEKKMLVLRNKVKAILDSLTDAVAQRSRSDIGEELPFSAPNMIEELNMLSSLLTTSSFDSESSLSIGELLKSLESKELHLDALLNPITRQNDPNEILDSEVMDDEKVSDNISAEDGEIEYSAATVTNLSNEAAACSTGKGKNKKKNKPKKGKGGRRK